jgi:hypothetical protein
MHARKTNVGFSDGSSNLLFRRDQGPQTSWWIQCGPILFDTGSPVADGDQQDMRIQWSTNSVTFLIDRNRDGTYQYSTNLAISVSTELPILLYDVRSVDLSQFANVVLMSSNTNGNKTASYLLNQCAIAQLVKSASTTQIHRMNSKKALELACVSPTPRGDEARLGCAARVQTGQGAYGTRGQGDVLTASALSCVVLPELNIDGQIAQGEER